MNGMKLTKMLNLADDIKTHINRMTMTEDLEELNRLAHRSKDKIDRLYRLRKEECEVQKDVGIACIHEYVAENEGEE